MKNQQAVARAVASLVAWASTTAVAVFVAAPTVVAAPPPAADPSAPVRNLQPYPDPTGAASTYSSGGRIDTTGPFFQSLGSNGRNCASCHAIDEAMSISPPQIKERFRRTGGQDPLFAPVDGANCPDVPRADPEGHSLLLRHGLIRIALGMPANAQFTISVVHDPYGCALVLDPQHNVLTVSVYRRPLPATNLSFLSAVMFDGRETVAPLTSGADFLTNLNTDLTHQANDAISAHFQAAKPASAAQVAAIVEFELGLSTAQIWDANAGRLDRQGASGGPFALASQEYYPGINDVLGGDPTGLAFSSTSMTLFTGWMAGHARDDDSGSDLEMEIPGTRARAGSEAERLAAREAIAAGEKLFNSAPLTIANVRGLNDNSALHLPNGFRGTCTTCHDAPNVGGHSLPLPLDIGVAHSSKPEFEPNSTIANAVAQLDEPNLPIFVIAGCPDPFSGQPAAFYTSDPGKALITGQCGDLNRLKGPILRGLAARAPYFHNGAAASLTEVVSFYNERFQMQLTALQKQELVAFLNSL